MRRSIHQDAENLPFQLDNRPMLTGSAYAAGIGTQETAAQMLYQRSVPLNSCLDQRRAAFARAAAMARRVRRASDA